MATKIHFSVASAAHHGRLRRATVLVNQSRLGYSSAIALGDAVMREVVARENFKAQHGECKCLFLDGKPVPVEWQNLSRADIRRRREEVSAA